MSILSSLTGVAAFSSVKGLNYRAQKLALTLSPELRLLTGVAAFSSVKGLNYRNVSFRIRSSRTPCLPVLQRSHPQKVGKAG